jgi:hypothetical protein
MDYLRDHLGEAPPLSEIMQARAQTSHSTSDTASPPLTRERRIIVGATGVGFVLYAIEREGPRVVGRIFDRLLDGGTAADVLRDSSKIPRDERELDRVWRSWVRDDYRR